MINARSRTGMRCEPIASIANGIRRMKMIPVIAGKLKTPQPYLFSSVKNPSPKSMLQVSFRDGEEGSSKI